MRFVLKFDGAKVQPSGAVEKVSLRLSMIDLRQKANALTETIGFGTKINPAIEVGQEEGCC